MLRIPMRHSLLACCFLFPLLPGVAHAQKAQKVKIDVHVGFATTTEQGETDERGREFLFKSGAWAPVYVEVEAGPDGTQQPGQVVVETTDSDEVQNRFFADPPLPPLEGGKSDTVLTYTKPGSLGSDIAVTVEVDGQSIEHKKTYDALNLGDTLYLTVGSRLPGLRKVLWERANQANTGNLLSRRRAAFVESVDALPTRWFGYDAVDLMILATGNRDFVLGLLNDQHHRKEALAEWVRRGGRLVITVGHNQDVVAKLLADPVAFAKPLPVEIKGKAELRRLLIRLGQEVPPLGNRPDARPGAEARPIEVARLETKIAQRDEDRVENQDGKGYPLIVRLPYGRGQVTMVAFDVDRRPFVNWAGQTAFWVKLLNLPAERAANAGEAPAAGMNRPFDDGSGRDLASMLQGDLEKFEDIPVISFGWVALFIFIYILVVGPLDYFFLKKVVKRLELTWITFPVVVLAVSAVAYFAAYALKGHDLKINKVDVVDIDLRGQQAYGDTWFTVFSPRIQHYTIGVEPSAPWVDEPVPEGRGDDVVVSWMGRPDASYGGYGRPRSQSLFRRAYDYGPQAAGLKGVPIQVWATKAFTASWARPLNPKQMPFTADLRRGQGDTAVHGTLTNNLPVGLQDVSLIYGGGRGRGSVLVIGPLAAGARQEINFRPAEQGTRISDWVPAINVGYGYDRRGYSTPQHAPAGSVIKRALFFEEASRQDEVQNRGLERLDQAWRVEQGAEAILFARIPEAKIGADGDPAREQALPTRLWLGELPGPGERPALPGTLAQETYMRVFIPVKAPEE